MEPPFHNKEKLRREKTIRHDPEKTQIPTKDSRFNLTKSTDFSASSHGPE
jgi:hypothetical protein